VTDKPERPYPEAGVFDLFRQPEPEPEDEGQEARGDESGEDDVEGHASGFHRPD
jgi:hypothetical protein